MAIYWALAWVVLPTLSSRLPLLPLKYLSPPLRTLIWLNCSANWDWINTPTCSFSKRFVRARIENAVHPLIFGNSLSLLRLLRQLLVFPQVFILFDSVLQQQSWIFMQRIILTCSLRLQAGDFWASWLSWDLYTESCADCSFCYYLWAAPHFSDWLGYLCYSEWPRFEGAGYQHHGSKKENATGHYG